MRFRTVLVGLCGSIALAGCVETAEFGGSGGSFGGSGGSGGFGGSGGTSSGNISLGRDMCLRAARDQNLNVARVDSVREYSFGSALQGVEVRMQVRRSGMSVNTEPRVCRFRYASGEADISRT
jgi:hypothetical protein